MKNNELAIVTYIKKHGIDKAIKDFNLKSRVYLSKILVKYDQLSSPTIMAMPEVQECRGLILDRDTWKVLSLAFQKFFNSEEGNAHKIDWNTAHVLEKLDGCCHEDIILVTEDGDKTIREICESKYFGKVLSFNLETNNLVFDEIVDHSVKKNINNWFEIELEDGTTLKLTGNHKVWLPELQCYRMVDDLTENDSLFSFY